MSGDAHPTSGCRAWTNQVHLTRFSRAPPVSATELAGPMAGPQPQMSASLAWGGVGPRRVSE